MKITVQNRQRHRQPNRRKLAALLRFFLRRPMRRSDHGPWNHVTVVLTDDCQIAPLNRKFFGRDGATDVISFTLPPIPGSGHASDGEIYLNVQRACWEGARRKGPAAELALYLAHGCDHLAGADDRSKREQRAMRRRELRWLEQARRLSLLKGLLQ
ncbi:MAG: rRNA maturation RNase YbeY [Lentisphaerae bacterium]|nr:rRNA maturation RNase YbeY [Lentisphaerota bacterium]